MTERSKKFVEALNSDFRALSNETRKKFHPVKEVMANFQDSLNI